MRLVLALLVALLVPLGALAAPDPPINGPVTRQLLDAMSRDASDATLPDARKNLNTGLVNVLDYGAVADTIRVQCSVTTVASTTAVTVAPGSALCAFTSADIGKPIVIWNVGSTATAPLATTIVTVVDGTHITVALAPGQTVTGSTQYISWGTDNSSALSQAYTQAAKQASATGQKGLVFFPPSNTTVGGLEIKKYYGTTAAMGVAPSGFRIATQGSGPYKSVVMALASISGAASGLLFESSSYADGNVIRDMGFEGNMLAQNVGYLACDPNGRLDNVVFATPAAGGINLKVGASGSGNCPALVAVAVRTDSALNTNVDQYPDKHIEINSTDTTWFNPLINGPAATYAIHAASTASNTAMHSPHTSSLVPINFQVDAAIAYLNDPQIDNGNVGTTTGIVVNAASTKIVGGRLNLPTASSVGILVNASKAGSYITGFDCNRFSVSANCINVTYPLGNNVQIFANGNSTIIPAFAQKLNQFPAGTTDTNGVLMGMNLTMVATTSAFVPVEIQGNLANTTDLDGAFVAGKYGTGTVPSNGESCSAPASGGVVVGGGSSLKGVSSPANALLPASGRFFATMVPGTTYWFDLCVGAITGGTASIANADIKVIEQNRY